MCQRHDSSGMGCAHYAHVRRIVGHMGGMFAGMNCDCFATVCVTVEWYPMV